MIPAESVATLKVQRQLQISLMEYPLEVVWNRRRLGRVWTGLSGVYTVRPGEGVLQLSMRRAFWGGYAVTEPLRLSLKSDETMTVAIKADNHVLAVCSAHVSGLRTGYRKDRPFGLPTLTITDEMRSHRVDWIFEPTNA